MQPEELTGPQGIKITPVLIRALRALVLTGGASLAALGWAFPAQAADIDVASKIEAVTVFPDAAQVRRVADANIPAGAHQLVFKGLPISLDVNSLRVRAAGAAGLVIGSVESRVAPLQVTRKSPLAEKLRELTNERSLLYQKLAALRAKRAMIQRYAKASPEKLGEKAAPMRVSDWDKAWNAVSDGLSKVAEEIQSVQLRQRRVSEEIRALRRSNRGKTSGSRARRIVSISVSGAAAGKARLYLTYRVRAARWRPVYDARLQAAAKPGKPVLELVRRASVVQWTGEDWNSVTLTVSTVRTNRGTQAPNLMAQRLEFYDPPPALPYPASGWRDTGHGSCARAAGASAGRGL